jgi:hypothetical protein
VFHFTICLWTGLSGLDYIQFRSDLKVVKELCGGDLSELEFCPGEDPRFSLS